VYIHLHRKQVHESGKHTLVIKRRHAHMRAYTHTLLMDDTREEGGGGSDLEYHLQTRQQRNNAEDRP